MQDFDEKYRRMPYAAEPARIEALRDRCLASTVGAQRKVRRPACIRAGRMAVLTAAAAAIVVCAVLLAERKPGTPPAPPTFDELVSAAPGDVLQRAAAENYDDLLYNGNL